MLKPTLRRSLVAAALTLTSGAFPVHAVTSKLWGVSGELWTPASRLPDFAWAGYAAGDQSIPDPAATVNVRDFGASGNGQRDDTTAFLKAIAAVKNGAIFIPAGRYRITRQLIINKSNVVLRGAGSGQTTLFFPEPLAQVAQTSPPDGSWSWCGGFVSFEGSNWPSPVATTITASAQRGDLTIRVGSTAGLSTGQWIRIGMTDVDGSLGSYLIGNVGSGPGSLAGREIIDFSVRIKGIQGNTLTLERPLRTDVRLNWRPVIHTNDPTIHDVGVEDLTFEFPLLPYPGHHSEPGYNAIDFSHVSNGWAQRLRIVNADSGIFLRETTKFVTIDNIVFTALPGRSVSSYDSLPFPATGHHGVLATSFSQDNLISHLTFEVNYIHELAVTEAASGNVFMQSSAPDMVIDHHHRAGFENLFTEIETGAGRRWWQTGGDSAEGPPAGFGETFWNVRSTSDQGTAPQGNIYWPQVVPMELIGIHTNAPESTSGLLWRENMAPEALQPPNLYFAQRAHRGAIVPPPAKPVPTPVTPPVVPPTKKPEPPPVVPPTPKPVTKPVTPSLNDPSTTKPPVSPTTPTGQPATFKPTTTTTPPQTPSASPLQAAQPTLPTNQPLVVPNPRPARDVALTPGFTGFEVYPNPWRADLHAGQPLKFGPLIAGSIVQLFTVSGREVKKLPPSGDLASWDLTNDSGELAASGLYIYLVTTPAGDTLKGKFAIIR